MGGEIQRVDLVRDQFSLKIPAGHAVRILFDERTQVYKNGQKISVLDLRPEDHASIETTLDGTSIFALRIHIATAVPGGQFHGKVERYNPTSGELKLLLSGTKDSITLMVNQGTPVERVGQEAFVAKKAGPADLTTGSLVDVSFKSVKGRLGEATRVDVLAVPGAEFMFEGTLTFLDLRAGRMSIRDSSESQTDVSFEPARFAASHDLRQGSPVKVSAVFDGTRYVATGITLQ